SLAAGVEIDELVLPNLALDDRFAEGDALPAIRDAGVEHKEGAGEAAHGGDEPLGLEVLHQIHEAVVRLAEEVALRHAHVVEEELRRVARLVADLLELLRNGKTGKVRGNEEERATVSALLWGRLREQRDEVGARAVRDERLLPAQNVVVTVLPS